MAVSGSRRLRLVLIAAAVGWLASGCGGERLTEFRSKAGRFRILLPGTPSTTSDPELPEVVRSIRLDQPSGSYVVAWEDVDMSDRTLSADRRLDLACDKAVEKLKGKALARKEITLAGEHPGRELVAATADGSKFIRDRMYLVEGRLYQVVASGPKWWVQSRTAERVFDSFELLDE
jgi:hypothetical protein